jgi:hypothetical protein
MQRLRDRATDAASRASYQRGPARQIEHQYLLSASLKRKLPEP